MIGFPPPPRLVYRTTPGNRLDLWFYTWLELLGCVLIICSFGWLNSDLREFAKVDP